MRPPKDADGGYYFDLVFRSDNQEAAVESGANILLFVGDEVIKAGQVEIANLQLVEQGAVVDVLFTNFGKLPPPHGGRFCPTAGFRNMWMKKPVELCQGRLRR